MYETTKDAPWEGAKTTTNETVNRIVNEKVADADILKIQTAKTLEDAARKLRNADISTQGEDLKHILYDVEAQVYQFKKEAGVKYDQMEADYHKRAEPVEHIIVDHPIPSVLIAAGIGALIGMLIGKAHD